MQSIRIDHALDMHDYQPARVAAAISIAARARAGCNDDATHSIAHPLAVSVLVIEHGGDEGQVLASLLHDAIDIGSERYADVIGIELGPNIRQMVEILSECTAEVAPCFIPEVPRAACLLGAWIDGQRNYVERMQQSPSRVAIVAACVQRHRLRSLMADLKRYGLVIVERLMGGRSGTLWQHNLLAVALHERVHTQDPVLAKELLAEVTRLRILIDRKMPEAERPERKSAETTLEMMRALMAYGALAANAIPSDEPALTLDTLMPKPPGRDN